MTKPLAFLSPAMVDKIAAAKAKQSGKKQPRKRKLPAKVRKVVQLHKEPAIAVKRKPGEFTRHRPATQKARGINALHSFFSGMPTRVPDDRSGRAHAYLQCQDAAALLPYDIPNGTHEGDDVFKRGKFFARPCPRTPRHGFVDSRPVSSLEEALCLWRDAVEVDPLAEVLLMERLTGAYSAVASDAGVTYGVGHDGVTGHSDQLWTVPAPQDALREYVNGHYATDTKFEGVYVEAVEAHGDVRLVQMRDGPPQQTGMRDYIPHDSYRVRYVVDGRPWKDDLVGWEKHINGQVRVNGTGGMVYAPGFSLASHVCVHGIALGLAVACDSSWKLEGATDEILAAAYVGKYLHRESSAPAMLTSDDYKRLASYIKSLDFYAFGKQPCKGYAPFVSGGGTGWHALTLDNSFCHSQGALATALGTLHAMATWGNEAHLLRLRAFGVVTLAKHLAAACLGEARHFYRSGPGYRQSATSSIDWSRMLAHSEEDLSRREAPRSREYVYCHALHMTLEQLRKVLPGCAEDFDGDWGQDSEDHECTCREECEGDCKPDGSDAPCGYGGPKWLESAKLALELVRALTTFVSRPYAENWSHVVTWYNKAVNATHNNGKLLDKWLAHATVYDIAAKVPQITFLNAIAMRVIIGDHTMESVRNRACLGEWIDEGLLAPRAFFEQEAHGVGSSGYPKRLAEWMNENDLWRPKT